MGLAQKPKFVSPQEYLAFERDALDKHEYLNGEIFARAGAGRRHNQICTNLFHLIGSRLKLQLRIALTQPLTRGLLHYVVRSWILRPYFVRASAFIY